MAAYRKPLRKPAHVDEMSGERGGGRHRRTHEMRAAAGALPPLEVAVRRRRATLARLEPVVVHREAHRAARLAPFEARVAERPVEALGFRLRLDETGAGHDHREP